MKENLTLRADDYTAPRNAIKSQDDADLHASLLRCRIAYLRKLRPASFGIAV